MTPRHANCASQGIKYTILCKGTIYDTFYPEKDGEYQLMKLIEQNTHLVAFLAVAAKEKFMAFWFFQ